MLKPRKPGLKMIAVEPEDSAVLSGGTPGPHRIQGLGAGFIPEILDTKLIDEVVRIGNDTAMRTAREAARLEALTVGISSGAALAAALEVGARTDMAGKTHRRGAAGLRRALSVDGVVRGSVTTASPACGEGLVTGDAAHCERAANWNSARSSFAATPAI